VISYQLLARLCFAFADKLLFCRFAFVDFESVEDAKKIVKSMNGQTIDGRPIKLDFAEERGSGRSSYTFDVYC